jgi:NitT/TauT family transport system ATP-binding protein
LNLIENLVFPVHIIKKEHQREDVQKAEDLLKQFGILKYKTFYPNQLSGGMLQRASVARAFMCDPKILLLDESFNAIDEQTRENLWVDLRLFWKTEHTTVILVTHSVREAIFFSDQVHVLSSKPATVTHTVEIDLPCQREKELIVDQHFNEIERKIRTLYGQDEK